MPAIVFYANPTQQDGPSRIAGMAAAGKRIRTGAPTVTNANGATLLVTGIVHDSLPGGTTNGQVRLQTSGGDFKVVSEVAQGHYTLDNTKKLRLRGDVDEQSAANFKMVSVVPAGATGGAWAYLTDTVVPDVLTLASGVLSGTVQPEHLQNYLIATFTFTRCR